MDSFKWRSTAEFGGSTRNVDIVESSRGGETIRSVSWIIIDIIGLGCGLGGKVIVINVSRRGSGFGIVISTWVAIHGIIRRIKWDSFVPFRLRGVHARVNVYNYRGPQTLFLMASSSKWDVKESPETSTKSLPYKNEISLHSSKVLTFIRSPEFESLLQEKLQLGPNEDFRISFSDKESQISASLEATSAEILALGSEELTCFAQYGHFRSSKSHQKSLKISIGFDPTPALTSFVRGKLLGPQGSYLKHIQDATRTKVQLRGKGSGYIEVVPKSPDTAIEPMYLYVQSAKDNADLEEAERLCQDLISTVKSDYDAKISPPQLQQQQYSQPQMYNPQYAAQYAQYAHYMAQYNQYYANLAASQQQQQQPPSSQDDSDKK